jgi:sigma-E factor negative regulatory protein RseC
MAEETGVVLSSGGGKARIRLDRKTMCGSCGGCLFSETQDFMIAEAEDSIGVMPGDTVRIASRTSATRAAFLVYLLPLIALIAGFTAGSAAARALKSAAADAWGIGAGFGLMALSYFILYLSQKKAARRGTGPMRIVRVVSRPSPQQHSIRPEAENLAGVVPRQTSLKAPQRVR